MPAEKRLPPYGARLRSGLRELRVYVGSGAWDRARAAEPDIVTGVCAHCGAEQLAAPDSRGNFVVLPAGEDAADYAWPVATLSVLVLVDGAWSVDECRRLGAILLDSRARKVVVVWPTSDLTVYEP